VCSLQLPRDPAVARRCQGRLWRPPATSARLRRSSVRATARGQQLGRTGERILAVLLPGTSSDHPANPTAPARATRRCDPPANNDPTGAWAQNHRVLADYMNVSGAAYESHLRDAIDVLCQRFDYNLVVVYGHALREHDPWTAAHNAIYGLVGPEAIDALIVLSSCLGFHSGPAAVERLLASLPFVPRCSIGLELPGVPSVVVDNRSAAETLVRAHDRRARLAAVCSSWRVPE